MPKATTQITDEELVKQLRNSYLEPGEKYTLESLIPHMTPDEREELLKIIKESEKVGRLEKQAWSDYNTQLTELNQEYEEKLNQLTNDFSKKARTEFEALEQTQEEKELKAVEDELDQI